jgi:hypothetical protein
VAEAWRRSRARAQREVALLHRSAWRTRAWLKRTKSERSAERLQSSVLRPPSRPRESRSAAAKKRSFKKQMLAPQLDALLEGDARGPVVLRQPAPSSRNRSAIPRRRGLRALGRLEAEMRDFHVLDRRQGAARARSRSSDRCLGGVRPM